MPKCDFDNSVEITLWNRCSRVNLLHIQVGKSEKYSGGGEGRGVTVHKTIYHHKRPKILI